MTKRKVKKQIQKNIKTENKTNNIKKVILNLIFFLLLASISYILVESSTGELLFKIFLLLFIITAFLSLAFLISLLILIALKLFK